MEASYCILLISLEQQQKQHEQYQQPTMKKTGGGNGSAVHSRVQSADKRRRNINSPQITVRNERERERERANMGRWKMREKFLL